MLSNDGLCVHSMRSVLLFLALAVNSDQFQILRYYLHAVTPASCSYVLLVCNKNLGSGMQTVLSDETKS